MQLVIAGGAGKVGRLVLPTLAQRYAIRVVDLVAPPAEPPVEFVPADATDYHAMRSVAEGQDALIYLATGSTRPLIEGRPMPDWAPSHFDLNVKGLYLTLQAAVDVGVRRFVHISSMSVFRAFMGERDLDDRAPDATSGYGLSKRLGEQVCESVCREHGIGITALRLILPVSDDEWIRRNDEYAEVATAASDVASAMLAALDHQPHGFEPYIVTGDYRERHLDWSRTKARLGWEPRMRRGAAQ